MNGRFEYPGHLIAAAVCSSSISCFSHHHQTDRIPAAAAGQLHKKCLRPDSSCLTSEYSRQFLSSCPSGFRVGEGLPDSSRRAGRRQLILPFTSRAPAHHNPGKSAARIGSIFVNSSFCFHRQRKASQRAGSSMTFMAASITVPLAFLRFSLKFREIWIFPPITLK